MFGNHETVVAANSVLNSGGGPEHVCKVKLSQSKAEKEDCERRTEELKGRDPEKHRPWRAYAENLNSGHKTKNPEGFNYTFRQIVSACVL
jgi:hypothetical protein